MNLPRYFSSKRVALLSLLFIPSNLPARFTVLENEIIDKMYGLQDSELRKLESEINLPVECRRAVRSSCIES